MPKGTILRFELDGRSIVGIVNDRGPVPDSVDFDLSREIADSLGMLSRGVDTLAYAIIGKIKGENNCGSKNRACQTATSRFINARFDMTVKIVIWF